MLIPPLHLQFQSLYQRLSLQSYPFYLDDWRDSETVAGLNLAQRGLYRELIDYCWRWGCIPDNPVYMAKLIMIPIEEMTPIWDAVRPIFERRDDGKLYHHKVESKRNEVLEMKAKRAEGGKKGGRPVRNLKVIDPKPQGLHPETLRFENDNLTCRNVNPNTTAATAASSSSETNTEAEATAARAQQQQRTTLNEEQFLRWPKTSEQIRILYPDTDDKTIQRIIDAAVEAHPQVGDLIVWEAVKATYKGAQHQRSSAMFVKTVPEWIKNFARRVG